MRSRNTPIEQFDLKTGATKATYPSIADVKAYGFDLRDIREVLDGEMPSADGYGWRFQPEAPAAEMAADRIQAFFDRFVHHVNGRLLPFAEFFEAFHAWLPPAERADWSRIRISRELRFKKASGTGTANRVYLINAAWEPCEPKGRPYAVSLKGNLCRAELPTV
ncbi:hypothetical protein NA78x_000356 [Anatilimnocola sp. NA78]|uniref:hypothetical protein n=1 Tax=Anatilimnocola sp. NA78 TaxID=3415683 RepID=UPI003CE494E2